MPVQQRTRIIPAPGKLPEVREQLVDWMKQIHALGRRASLGQRLFSTEGQMFVASRLADDVAGLDKMRQEDAASADYQARTAKLTPLLAQPIAMTVFERVGDMPIKPGLTIGQFALLFPKAGSVGAMRQTLESFVRDRQGAGTVVGLWQRLFSSEGPSFAVYSRYADLAELDKQRQAAREAVQALGVALADHTRAPAQIRLWETIVPMPPPR